MSAPEPELPACPPQPWLTGPGLTRQNLYATKQTLRTLVVAARMGYASAWVPHCEAVLLNKRSGGCCNLARMCGAGVASSAPGRKATTDTAEHGTARLTPPSPQTPTPHCRHACRSAGSTGSPLKQKLGLHLPLHSPRRNLYGPGPLKPTSSTPQPGTLDPADNQDKPRLESMEAWNIVICFSATDEAELFDTYLLAHLRP